MKTIVSIAFLSLALFGQSALAGGWELVAEHVRCRDGADGYSKRRVYVGYDVKAIKIQNIRDSRGTTIRNVRLSRGSYNAQDKASYRLEGPYYGATSRRVRFRRAQDIDTMFFRCTSHKSSKRSYINVWVRRGY